MRSAAIALFLATGLAAQQGTPPEPAKTAAPQPEAPPQAEAPKKELTPKERAREILDQVSERVSSATPEVQVAGLMHLASNYQLFDPRKSLDLLDQAFAATAGVTSENARAELQGLVADRTAEIDPDRAIEMVRQIAPPKDGYHDERAVIAGRIVNRLISKNQLDKAVGFLETYPPGEYPHRSAANVLSKLPEDDPRRIQIFSLATTSFQVRPVSTFGDLIAETWRSMPKGMVEPAVQSFVNWVLESKQEGGYARTIASDKGAVSLGNKQDSDLFNIMHILREVDPKRAEEILLKRPALAGALEKFPEGVKSMGNNLSTNTTSGNKPNPEQQARMQLEALADTRAREAVAAASKDPQKGVSMVKLIPLPAMQATALGRIANSVGDKDPATAKSVIGQCVKLLDEIKEPHLTISVWISLAEAAHKAQDLELARTALDRGMADAAALYKSDVDEENPNRAIREQWPSTQYYRRLVYTATKIFGAGATAMLDGIKDPDLHLLASIEMAQSLLERPGGGGSISVSRSGRRR